MILVIVIETKPDSSSTTALLELFLMGMLSQEELEAELARQEELESGRAKDSAQ